MLYNYTLLTTKEDCQSVLSIAQKEKSDLELQKMILERKVDDRSETSAEIEVDLITVNAEVSALQSAVASMPEGNAKAEIANKLKKYEHRQFLLTERKDNYGVVSLFDKEFDIGCIEKQIEEATAFIAGLQDQLKRL